ncbi:MAG: ABC transporter permease [Vampirovibrionales bacterium]
MRQRIPSLNLQVMGVLFTQWIVRDWQQNVLRTSLSIIGIALGVAIAFAMSVSNQAAIEQFSQQVNALSRGASTTLRSQTATMWDIRPMLPELNRLWQTGGRWKALRKVELRLLSETSPVMLTWLSVDMLSASTVPDSSRDTAHEVLSSKHQPSGLWQRLDYYQRHPEEGFVSPPIQDTTHSAWSPFTPGVVWVSDTLAQRYHWKQGSTFQVVQDSRTLTLTVGAIYQARALLDSGLSEETIIGDIAASAIHQVLPSSQINIASKVLSKEQLQQLSEVSQVLVWQAPGTATPCTLFAPKLPSGVVCESPQVETQQTSAMLASYRGNLKALSLIALLVSMLLIYNTYAVGILRRRSTLGVLRGLNIPSVTLTYVLVLESLVLGLIGSVLGVVLGVGLAQLSLQGVSQTMQLLYTGQAVTQLQVSLGEWLWFIGLGTGATLLATLVPIQEARHVPPAHMVGAESVEPRLKRYTTWLTALGIFLALLSYGLCQLPPWLFEGVPVWGFLAAKSVNFAGILLMPATLLVGLPMLKRVGAWGMTLFKLGETPATWHIAVALTMGHLSRSWMAVSSLLVTVGLLVSLSIMIFSFQRSVQAWIQQSLRADLWIQSMTREVSKRSEGLIPTNVLQYIQHHPGVEALDDFYETQLLIEGRTTRLGAGRSEHIQHYGNLRMLEGASHTATLQRLRHEPDTALISEAFSHKFNKHLGDTLSLGTPLGQARWRIIGVYADYASDLGYVIVDKKTYIHWFKRNPTNSVAVYLKPHTSTTQVKASLLKSLPKDTALIIQTNRELKAEILRIFNRTFAITYALQAITLGITLLTLLGALLMMTLLSAPLFQTLYRLGMSRQRLYRVLVYQSLLLGGFGVVGGSMVGSALAIILVEVINKQAFGWSIAYAIPWHTFIQWGGYGIATLLLSAWLTYQLTLKKKAFLAS